MTAAGITRRHRIEPTHPTEGPFPVLTYTYNPDTGGHRIECACGDFVESTEPITARRFASTHTGDHARLRIATPAAELDREEP